MAGKISASVASQSFLEIKSESGKVDLHYFAFIEDLPEEFKLKANKELNETQENKIEGIQKLRDFAKKENITCTDDDLLTVILRNCKYNIGKSEIKLRKFLDTRNLLIDRVKEVDMRKFKIAFDDMAFGILPYKDKHGRAIIYTRPNINLDKYDMEDCAVCVAVSLLFLLSFPMTSVTGVSYIVECKTPSLTIFYPVFKIYRKYLASVFTFPIRFQRLEFVNQNFLCRWFYNIIHPILPTKVTKRVTFHGSGYKNLLKVYHPCILPDDFGGSLGPLSIEHYRDRLLQFVEEIRTGKRT